MKPADITAEWDWIKPLLEKHGSVPDPVYSECECGRADLYVDGGGFLILSNRQNEDTGGAELFVWVAIFPGKGNIAKHEPFLLEEARRRGAETISCRTARAGMMRLLPSEWGISHIEFVRSVG